MSTAVLVVILVVLCGGVVAAMVSHLGLAIRRDVHHRRRLARHDRRRARRAARRTADPSTRI